MHSHRNTFVMSASPLYYNVISAYIWLFLCCSIRKKYGVKKVVFLSPIYHSPAMTGYINMPFTLDPREGMWSASKCTMNKVKEIKKKEQTKPVCWQTCCLGRLLLILWWKQPLPPLRQHLPQQHEANGRTAAEPGRGRKDAAWLGGWG